MSVFELKFKSNPFANMPASGLFRKTADRVLQASAAERRAALPPDREEFAMALYFFNLHEAGQVLLDPDGCVLPDLAAVAEKAMVAARSILSAGALEGRMVLDMR